MHLWTGPQERFGLASLSNLSSQIALCVSSHSELGFDGLIFKTLVLCFLGITFSYKAYSLGFRVSLRYCHSLRHCSSLRDSLII